MLRGSWRVAVGVVVVAGLVAGGLLGACGGSPSTTKDSGAPEATGVPSGSTQGTPQDHGLPGAWMTSGAAGSPGITSSQAGTAASHGPSSIAVAELLAAIGKVDGQNLVFSLGDGIASAEGHCDAVSAACVLTRTVDGRHIAATAIGPDLYLTGVVPGGATMRVTIDQLPGGHTLLPVAVPLAALRILGGVTRAESSTNTYTGRLDLTKVDSGTSQTMRRFVGYLSAQAGDRAADIPFTATVDGFGRLAGFRAVFPRADGGRDLTYEFAIKDIGGSVAVTAPVSEIIEAPASFYIG